MWQEARRLSVLWARRYARTHDDAEDIAQEALLRAWRRRGTVRRSDRFDAWLAVIVRNEAARHYAKRRPDPLELDALETAVEDEAITAVVDRAEVDEVLAGLAEHERLLLRLRYDEDLTQSAMAERLGLPEGTVKVQLHRARGKLRNALDQGHGELEQDRR